MLCNFVCFVKGNRIWIQRFVALLTVYIQVKLSVSFITTQSTHKFGNAILYRFFLRSFLVSPQIDFRCRIVKSWNLSGFDVTVKFFVGNMYIPNVEIELFFASECLSQVLQGNSTFLFTCSVIKLKTQE